MKEYNRVTDDYSDNSYTATSPHALYDAGKNKRKIDGKRHQLINKSEISVSIDESEIRTRGD